MIGKILTDEDGKKWEVRTGIWDNEAWVIWERKPTPMPELKAGDIITTRFFSGRQVVLDIMNPLIPHCYIHVEDAIRPISYTNIDRIDRYEGTALKLTWKREG